MNTTAQISARIAIDVELPRTSGELLQLITRCVDAGYEGALDDAERVARPTRLNAHDFMQSIVRQGLGVRP